jgi:hypothetical protein
MQTLTEMERLQVIRHILHDAQSPNTPDLCRNLQTEHNRAYCASLLNRSHLWEVAVVESPSEAVYQIEGCPNHDAWCITNVALKHSFKMNTIEASRTCSSIQEARSREECLFQVAEQLIETDNPTYFTDAFDLCTKAPNFKNHCQSHLIEQLAKSNSSNSSLVQILTEIHQQSELFPTDPVDYFYSQRALYFPNDVTLPIEHLNSVQTYQFLREQQKISRTLKEWMARFADYKQHPKRFAPVTVDGHIQNYWVGIKSQKTYYLSIEQRPTSEDNTLDLQLAMVSGLVEFRFPLEIIRQEYSSGAIYQMLSKVNKPQQTNKN